MKIIFASVELQLALAYWTSAVDFAKSSLGHIEQVSRIL